MNKQKTIPHAKGHNYLNSPQRPTYNSRPCSTVPPNRAAPTPSPPHNSSEWVTTPPKDHPTEPFCAPLASERCLFSNPDSSFCGIGALVPGPMRQVCRVRPEASVARANQRHSGLPDSPWGSPHRSHTRVFGSLRGGQVPNGACRLGVALVVRCQPKLFMSRCWHGRRFQ